MRAAPRRHSSFPLAAHHGFVVWAVQLNDILPRVVATLDVHFDIVMQPDEARRKNGWTRDGWAAVVSVCVCVCVCEGGGAAEGPS